MLATPAAAWSPPRCATSSWEGPDLQLRDLPVDHGLVGIRPCFPSIAVGGVAVAGGPVPVVASGSAIGMGGAPISRSGPAGVTPDVYGLLRRLEKIVEISSDRCPGQGRELG
ncbi:hypothetical protein ACIB24_09055 [Spongisporangium articulatum]|uniref:Uncharacterized protein n=1 Tax=Spongisporangium articulatum TaxID=3362603 RepID=A0ABW8ANM7_9ACTN